MEWNVDGSRTDEPSNYWHDHAIELGELLFDMAVAGIHHLVVRREVEER
jgi:hypothetical protein